jgi:hypothetical protein
MSSMGELPRADYAVFADPGAEKKDTYEYIEWLLRWEKANQGIPIIIKKDKNLKHDLIHGTNSTGGRFTSIPAFTKNADGGTGMLRRQCTNEYKIEIVDQAIREIHGLARRKRNIPTIIWKGISLDEAVRMSNPTEKWKTYYYPYIGYATSFGAKAKRFQGELYKPMDRNQIVAWYNSKGFPIPPKSSCVFCPYHNDHSWKSIKESPEDWEQAVELDKAIRNSTQKGVNQPVFLHRSLVPLDEVIFNLNEPDLPLGECSGECDV